MFRTHQFIAACLAVAMGSAAAVAASTPAGSGEVVEVTDLQPFTHVAYIPVGADLSSIKFAGVRAVNVAARLRSVTSTRYCQDGSAEPGGSMYCPRTTNESPAPAYQVSYSYKGQPMASDEYGSAYFTFSVYFRPDELNPRLLRALSSGHISRTAAAEFFHLMSSRDSVPQIVINPANSKFCDGNYVDGNWTHTNQKCQDAVTYKTVASRPLTSR